MPAVEELLEDMDATSWPQSSLYTLEEWNRRPWYRRAFLPPLLKLFAIWL
jgi:cardiolipin synthase